MAAFHDQFVQALKAGAGAYAGTEAANAAAAANPWQMLQQDVLGAINTPTELLLGRPLIGNGANGLAGTGQNGGGGLCEERRQRRIRRGRDGFLTRRARR